MQLTQFRIDVPLSRVMMRAETKRYILDIFAMHAASTRIFLGGVAGAIAMLMFHQVTLQVFFWCGLTPQAAFRIAHVPPFNIPMVVSITFWGAVYGGVFGWFVPRMPGSLAIRGLLAGVFATLMGWFVVRPIAGYDIAFGWAYWPMLRSAAANLMWGVGVALILPLLNPRCMISRSRQWAQHHLAT
jgi:hypothetical protein